MRFVDLTGKRFGKLIVVGRTKVNKSKNVKWDCLCDCGKYASVFRTTLPRSKSCGCSHYVSGSQNPKWRGCGDISLRHYNVIRKRAIEREMEFNLGIEFLWELFLRQNKSCAISGMPLTFDSKGTTYDGSASLDRIDSTKGYITTNVQWTHKAINMMKSNHPLAHFVDLCKKVVEHDRNTKTV